jgi:hypothetical protein
MALELIGAGLGRTGTLSLKTALERIGYESGICDGGSSGGGQYAFSQLEMHRVFSRTDARNLRAQRLLERLTFRREGELRESTWFKGAWAAQLSRDPLGSVKRGAMRFTLGG